MKQLLSLLICFGLVIAMGSLVGCGDDKKPAAPAADKAKADKDKEKDKK